MSLIYKCDVCGKDSAMKGTAFSQGPLMLKINNYNNEPMRVYVQVTLESEADFMKIEQFKEHLDSIEPGISMEEAADDPDFADDFNQFRIQLDNPFPMICDACKKMLAVDNLRNAEVSKIKPTYSNSSMRTKDDDQNLAGLTNIEETIEELDKKIKKGDK